MLILDNDLELELEIMSTQINLTQEFDARIWAKEWLRILSLHPEISTDEGTMIGWFSNALMCGYDEHDRRTKKIVKKTMMKMKSLKSENKGLKHYIKRIGKLKGIK